MSASVPAFVHLTPAMMASAFWGMDSGEQVEFLRLLAIVIQADHCNGNRNAYSLGELQWYYTGDELLKPENKQAREMLMTMAAPLYLHTLRACGMPT